MKKLKKLLLMSLFALGLALVFTPTYASWIPIWPHQFCDPSGWDECSKEEPNQ